jgi:hypothetical protein
MNQTKKCTIQDTTKQEREDFESNAAKAKVSSPQLSGRRRRKLPPAGKPAVPGRRRRHAGAWTEGPGGDGDGHFCHLLPPLENKKRSQGTCEDGDQIWSRRRGVRLCYKGEGADGIMTMISMAVAAALSIG